MEQLKKWRMSLPKPQNETAAKALGVSVVQLWRLENGKRRIPAERVAAFSAVTGIPRHELRPDIFTQEPAQ